MNYYLLVIFFTLLLSQEFSWERIEQIQEGYQYNIDTNSIGDIIIGGFDLESDFSMQIYYKQNNQDWIEIPGNDLVTIMSGDVLITETQNIYVCDFAMGLYKTNDLGENWSTPSELSFDGCSTFNIHENGTYFMGMTYSGIGFIHRSFDNGLIWEAIPLPDYDSNYPVEHIEFDNEGNIYLGTINGIYKSLDNGGNWQKVNNGINGEHVSSIFVDDNDNIYIYTTYPSLADCMYYSIDNAESWTSLLIPDYYVVDILVRNDIIMIIDGYNNIQVTEDFGNTWSIYNEGLSDNALYGLHLRYDNTIYVSGRYIHKSNNSSFDECFDLTGIDFGICTMTLGIGFINGGCNYISGCDWIIDGIDYSGLLFESIEECEEACNIGDPIELGDVNFDGEINILDAVLLISFILEDLTDEFEFIAGDINQDSSLDILDIVLLIEMILSSELLEECYIIPEVGPCEGICPTYYYNQDINQCEEFITGCCGVEAFNTLLDCQNICE